MSAGGAIPSEGDSLAGVPSRAGGSPRAALAQETFAAGFNCGQAVLLPFALERGLSRETALALAGGLGAGLGRLQETCGAVTGAILALGLAGGQTAPEDAAAKARTYARVQTLAAQFAAAHGTIRCRDLLGLDLRTPEGQNRFKTEGLHQSVCARCVETAVRLTEGLLAGD